MEDIHKELLQENFTYLKKNVRPFEVIDHLYEKNILPEDDVERLKNKKTLSKTADQLVRFLPRCGPDAFSCFVMALTETKQSHVSEFLLDKEKQKQQQIIEGMLYAILLRNAVLLFYTRHLSVCLAVCLLPTLHEIY